MKIECLLEHIQTPLTYIVRSASKSSTLPSLQGIFLGTNGNKLTLTSTNLDIGLSVTIPVKTEREGSVLINADTFGKVITSLPTTEKTISIEQTGSTITLTTNKTVVTINTLTQEDFPTLPKIEGTQITLQKDILNEGIKSVVFATATTDIKPEISAVYIYTEPGTLTFVGTDSFRLAEKKIKTKNSDEIKILIPNKNAQEILKILEICADDILVTYSSTMMTIQTSTLYATFRVVDGVFPDYRRIIPSENNTETKILKQDLANLFKITNIFSDTFNQVNINVQEKNLECITKNQNIGSVDYSIPCQTTGSPISMNFNYRYVQEVLPIISKESISFSFMNEQKAMTLRAVGDDSFLYLVMPLNR